jgi:hypothetical protein
MACSRCSNDEHVAERSAAYQHAVKLAKQAKDDLGVELSHDDIITLAYFLSGVTPGE